MVQVYGNRTLFCRFFPLRYSMYATHLLTCMCQAAQVHESSQIHLCDFVPGPASSSALVSWMVPLQPRYLRYEDCATKNSFLTHSVVRCLAFYFILYHRYVRLCFTWLFSLCVKRVLRSPRHEGVVPHTLRLSFGCKQTVLRPSSSSLFK